MFNIVVLIKIKRVKYIFDIELDNSILPYFKWRLIETFNPKSQISNLKKELSRNLIPATDNNLSIWANNIKSDFVFVICSQATEPLQQHLVFASLHEIMLCILLLHPSEWFIPPPKTFLTDAISERAWRKLRKKKKLWPAEREIGECTICGDGVDCCASQSEFMHFEVKQKSWALSFRRYTYLMFFTVFPYLCLCT